MFKVQLKTNTGGSYGQPMDAIPVGEIIQDGNCFRRQFQFTGGFGPGGDFTACWDSTNNLWWTHELN